MKNLAFSFVALAALGYAGYSGYMLYVGPCARPLVYSIGEFDQRFGISEELFKSNIAGAETVWEKALGKDVFRYQEGAKFKINLVYDTRQERTDSKERADFGLTAIEETFNKIEAEFKALDASYQAASNAYDAKKAGFERRSQAYEEKVEFWNSRGGAPKNEFEELEAERSALNQEAAELNAEAASLNAMTKEVNQALESRNQAAAEYNQVVREYNRKFGHGVEFNQAEYTPSAINVYQFTSSNDLRLALAHEFGHALGMDHTEGAKSIMYFESEEGSASILTPSQEDLEELRRVCKLGMN